MHGRSRGPEHWTVMWSHPRLIAGGLMLLPVVLLLVDKVIGAGIRLAPLTVGAPALAAAFCSPSGVLAVTTVTVACVVLSAKVNLLVGWTNFYVQLTTLVLISLGAVGASWIRGRRESELARTRAIAEVTQRVLLKPLPPRLGGLALASVYLAADEDAAVGGDLYAVADLGGCVRILVGDAHGKGLAALETASYVLSAFRRSLRRRGPLSAMVADLEEDFRTDLRDAVAARPDAPGTSFALEEFVTAVVLEIPESGDGPTLVANLGHPPPLLIDGERVVALDPTSPAPPLGLGDLGRAHPHVDEVDFPSGATLLLYTDGVIEARDRYGDFYPLAERLPGWTRLRPQALVEAIHSDLRRYVGRGLGDDVTMVAVRRERPPQDLPSPSGLPGCGRAGGSR
ncbi:PP2C family protein-serine/threonine phosphatase [Streptomyces sp. NPDC052043]|uniref:PP2C family protein-serine/threonine phosphatase n=1 Tax=Streptomyces sp. NPDC052043 TaxID=3365684 RepID=UPI0037D6B548